MPALLATRSRRAPAPPPLAVAPAVAADLLSICVSRVYQLMRKGELESYQDGASRRIPMQALQAYIARRLANSAAWRQIVPPPRERRRRETRERV